MKLYISTGKKLNVSFHDTFSFFSLTLIFFYEKGFVSPCVKHIKSFDFESLKAALQLQLLLFFYFSQMVGRAQKEAI